MIPMSLPEIAAVVDGEVHDDSGVTVTGPAFIDSRAVVTGGLFAAFPGDRVDGHDFAPGAVAAGAAAVLANRPVGVPAVVVADTQVALGALARHVLAQLPRVKVVALTGSQGKTSTKDLLAKLLAVRGTTVATAGSFNNEIGFPLTVLRADAETELLVLEMGARGIGHLRDLCAIARPDVSLVLNVGKAHLGEFGTQADIARAKGEIVDALGPEGVAVLNADDSLVAAMADRCAGRVVTFGERSISDVRLEGLELDALGRPRFDLVSDGETAHVEMTLLGEHQAHNAAAAAAVGLELGVTLADAAGVLSRAAASSRWRMEVHERDDGVTVVNDAYNANPDSMRAALKALAAMGRGRDRSARGARTIAVLGEMRELGAASLEEHDAVGRLAVRLDIGQLIVVGEEARPLHLGAALEGSWNDESLFVPDKEQALAWLRRNLRPGDVVLVKASRAAGLETVAEALVADGARAADPGTTGTDTDTDPDPDTDTDTPKEPTR